MADVSMSMSMSASVSASASASASMSVSVPVFVSVSVSVKECARSWLHSNNTCPNCRALLGPSAEDGSVSQ